MGDTHLNTTGPGKGEVLYASYHSHVGVTPWGGGKDKRLMRFTFT